MYKVGEVGDRISEGQVLGCMGQILQQVSGEGKTQGWGLQFVLIRS